LSCQRVAAGPGEEARKPYLEPTAVSSALLVVGSGARSGRKYRLRTEYSREMACDGDVVVLARSGSWSRARNDP